MNQKEFARAAKVSEPTLHCWIYGKHGMLWPMAVKVSRVANRKTPGLGCTPTKIMENIGKGNKLRKILGIKPLPPQPNKRKEAA